MFETYFQEELAYLRDAGRVLAAKHTAVAGMLADRSADPSVERLIEGFAFLAARLRQRTDDPAPELLQGITELLLPSFLRPTPASTILEFVAAPGPPPGQERLAAGILMLSRPVRGTVCPFRTTRTIDLTPLSLVAQQLDDSSASRPELSLRFQVGKGGRGAVFRPEGLRLHLHGDLPTATQLYLWFARHVSAVTVRTGDGRSVELGSSSVKLVGLDDADPLFPWPSFSPQGLRLLLEYFALPPKFLFIDVVGLHKAAHLECSNFDLTVRFARPPALPQRLAADALRLHCVPAINLFDVASEALHTPNEGRPTLLRGAGLKAQHTEVFEVRSVIGTSADRSESRPYEPANSFRRPFNPLPNRRFYKLNRELSPVDNSIQTFLHVESPPDEPSISEELLKIQLTCTSGSLTNELQVGDVSVATNAMPTGMRCSNIAAVTHSTRPDLGSEQGWHFISHLSASTNIMTDIEVLKTFLSLYNFQERSDYPKGRANRARIEAIRAVSCKVITRIVQRAALRGTLFRVEVEQTGFESEGDAFLFGSVLHRVLGDRGAVNTFVDLELVLIPSERSFRWKAEDA